MVDTLSLRESKLYLDKLPVKTRQAFLSLADQKQINLAKWYLAGGTALALQVGHRQSVDLDFFTPLKKFDELKLERELSVLGGWRTTFRQAGTIYGELNGAKVSFIAYPFFIPGRQKEKFGAIKILLPNDIAAMKIIAISQRGRKRDFIDLYWYCQNVESLQRAIERAIESYPSQESNLPHFIKSLVYFADAEADPMPKLFFEASWPEVKKFFIAEVRRLSKTMLGLR